MKGMARIGMVAAALAALSLPMHPATSAAAEGGHAGMAGMKHGSGGAPAHDMSKMGDKVYEGKVGPWLAKARLMDMKAHMAVMAPGMKVEGPMPNSHHLAVTLSDAKTKKAIAEGNGSVIVTGPDGKSVKGELMLMQGHFGVDVNLPAPGKYAFKLFLFSGGGKGNATFSYTVK